MFTLFGQVARRMTAAPAPVLGSPARLTPKAKRSSHMSYFDQAIPQLKVQVEHLGARLVPVPR